MCIVEALRVVEGVRFKQNERESPPLPWQSLDNIVVKVHVSRARLPERPKICTDEEWALVMRMCRHEPLQRIKMTTVVDELARLAKRDSVTATSDAVHQPNEIISSAAESEGNRSEPAPEVIAAIKLLVTSPRQNEAAGSGNLATLFDIYKVLWDRFERVHAEVARNASVSCWAGFEALVESAREGTLKLDGVNDTLVDLTEAILRGCTLHRRLDKLIAANFLDAADSNGSGALEWKPNGFARDDDVMHSGSRSLATIAEAASDSMPETTAA